MLKPGDKYDTRVDKGSSKVRPKITDEPPPPEWLPFVGFSYLFDNPGDALSIRNGYRKLCAQPSQSPPLSLYAKIAETLQRLDVREATTRYQFYPLPPETYHVTLWDGVNSGNCAALNKTARGDFDRIFSHPPDSVLKDWPPMMSDFGLADPPADCLPIKFRYRKIEGRGETVLVVDLVPADAREQERFEKLETYRSALDTFFQRFDKPQNYSLRPHVAVGYFADGRLGDQGMINLISEWMDIFNEALAGQTIEFDSVSLFAFSDMVTYFKPE